MRDTLRRKPGKSVDLDANDLSRSPSIVNSSSNESSQRHQRSVSNASVIAGGAGEKNPWINDAPSSRSPVTDSPDSRGRAQNLDVPGSERSERSVSEKPTRRRKKTLNQVTPHRFELVDARRASVKPPPAPDDTRSATPSDEIVVSKTRPSTNRHSEEPDSPLSFSGVRSVGNITQTQPKELRRNFSKIKVSASISPIAASSPHTPPESTHTSPKRRSDGFGADFIGMDFGASRPGPSVKLVTSPDSAAPRLEEPYCWKNGTVDSAYEPYTYRTPHDPLPSGSLFNKVVIITNGTSVISAPLVRTLHRSGARIIFSSSHNLVDKSRNLVRELGPPDTIHFNACDLGKYDEIHALFKLGMTMYGRVDHAIFAPGDDGGQACGVGAGEKLWGLDVGLAEGRAMTSKAEIEVIERGEAKAADNVDVGDIIGASVRFARVAIAFLRNSPGRRQVHAGGKPEEMLTPTSGGGFRDSKWSEDRTLTFVSSTAAFMPVPYLPVYSSSQHAMLGITRSLSQSVDVKRDGVRVNLVATNMLLPSVVEAAGGGRMSVRLPGEKGDDIGALVAAIIGEGLQNKGEHMHGRVLYANGDEAVDVQDGLEASERSWLGARAKEGLERASGKSEGLGRGSWMLMDTGVDAPF